MMKNFRSDALLDFLHRSVRRRFHSLGFQSRYLQSDIGRIHYLVGGNPAQQTTLVLIHGIGTSSSTWLKTVPRLREHFRIIAMDLPGFGFSTVEGSRRFCLLQEHVAAVTEVLDTAAPGRFALLGHSFGGWIAAKYASEHQDRVDHLILVNTAGVYYRGVEKLRDLFTPRSVQDTRNLLSKLWFRYPWYFKPFAGAIYRELCRRGMSEVINSIDADSFLVEELTRLRMPVSIIWGKEDGVISQETISVLAKFVPQAAVEFIDRCGHVPQLERPDRFVDALEKLLDGGKR
ncbi:MAG TPA: alpha/beta hydrolase [Bacteroidota bacterium]|nr:alpha/beta hydrolase [Bacteroidota bacterium]